MENKLKEGAIKELQMYLDQEIRQAQKNEDSYTVIILRGSKNLINAAILEAAEEAYMKGFYTEIDYPPDFESYKHNIKLLK